MLLALPATAFVFMVISMSLRPRGHVTVYRDESRAEIVLRVLQDQRVAFLTRTYTVLASGGEPIAKLRKTYIHNIVRKRWYVEAPDGRRLAMAIEDSIVLSLLRRVLGPLFGFLRTNFVLVRGEHAEVFGGFNRKFTLLDRYVLDLSADPARTFDRRGDRLHWGLVVTGRRGRLPIPCLHASSPPRLCSRSLSFPCCGAPW